MPEPMQGQCPGCGHWVELDGHGWMVQHDPDGHHLPSGQGGDVRKFAISMIQTRPRRTGTSMKKITFTITVLLSATGCDLWTPADSCEPGALYDSLTDEEKESCAECNDAYGCDDDSGSGDDDGTISCIGDADDGTAELCVVGGPLEGDWTSEWTTKQIADCHTPTSPIQCIRSWSDPNGEADEECVMCEALVFGITPPTVTHPTHTGDWPMCMTADNLLDVYHRYRPAYDWGGVSLTEPTANWFDFTACSLDSDVYAGTCEPVLMATKNVSETADSFIGGQWTCRCQDDDDCQLGAVCNAGWVIDGGIPQPTLCNWAIDGDSNGVAPEGPVVYGLNVWSDGILADGDRVTMTPQFYRALVPGVLNDDQKFGLLGDLTYVGPDSLAAHLGLEVGDMFDADQRILDALEGGDVVELTVTGVDGSERVLSVSIE